MRELSRKSSGQNGLRPVTNQYLRRTAMTTFDESIAALDVSIFAIGSATTPDDRRGLLAIQNAVRGLKNDYVYLECGSNVGGTLLPHVLDQHCRLAYSVDKRPAADQIAKVRAFDLDASELTAGQIIEKPDLVLIDAEHTNVGVFSDFLSIYPLCHPATIYTLHDADLIYSGLQNIERFLRYAGVAFVSYVLPTVVYMLAANEACGTLQSVGEKFGLDGDQFVAEEKNQLINFHYEVVRQRLADQAKGDA
jgi:hypothetical protein